MRHFSSSKNTLRSLMADELEKVCGGEGEDTDELPQTSLDPITVSAWQDEVASGAYVPYVVNAVIGLASTVLGSAVVSGLGEAEARERVVSGAFDPTQLVREIQGWSQNGELVHGWLMKDGSMYWDNNKNGRPDQHTWIDDSGNLWEDIGTGRRQVTAHPLP